MNDKVGWYYNLYLIVAVGFADAAFVGTVPDDSFTDNWKRPAFAVHSDTEPLIWMKKSEVSALIEFIIMQSVLNVCLEQSWLYRVVDSHFDDQIKEKSYSRRMLTLIDTNLA